MKNASTPREVVLDHVHPSEEQQAFNVQKSYLRQHERDRGEPLKEFVLLRKRSAET